MHMSRITIWLIAIFPIFYIPFLGDVTAFQKYIFLSVSVLCAAIFTLRKSTNERTAIIYSGRFFYALLAFLGVTLLTGLMSYDRTMSFFGTALTVHSVATVLLVSFALLWILQEKIVNSDIYQMFRISTYISALVLPCILLCTHILDIPVHIFGSSIGLSIYASMCVFFAVYVLEQNISKRDVWASIVSLCVSYIVLVTSNFAVLPGISILFLTAVLLFVYFVIIYDPQIHTRKVVLRAVGILTALFLLSFPLQKFVNTEANLVQVTAGASVHVLEGTFDEGFTQMLVGVGQNLYPILWARYKPVSFPESVNITEYWNHDFTEAFSFIATSMSTGGFIHVLLWVLIYAYVVMVIGALLKVKGTGATMLGVVTGFLWLLQLVSSPGIEWYVYAFVFLAISILYVQQNISHPWLQVRVQRVSHTEVSSRYKYLYYSALVVVIMVTMGIGVQAVRAHIGTQYAVSASKDMALLYQGGQGDVQKILQNMQSAISYHDTDEYWRLLSELYVYSADLSLETNAGVAPQYIDGAVSAAIYSVGEHADSSNFRNWLQLGKVYEIQTHMGSTSTAPLAFDAYTRASLLAPTHPLPAFMLAQVYVYAGDNEAAKKYLQQTLTLKPNFTEALRMYNELNATSSVSSGNMGR